jgi:acyl carrier protein
MQKNNIKDLVLNSISEFNESSDKKIKISEGRDAALYGEQNLDSLSLVNLIVKLEEDINDQLNTAITLTSEKAMSRSVSPFLTIGTLLDYINELLQEA